MEGPPTAQVEISIEQAITVAERHRDQLVAGSRLLDALPRDAAEGDYLELQRRLAEQAPDVEDSSWGHKYLSLMHPDRLDDFHTVDFQDFHLIRCLQMPPEGEGRYLAAPRFVAMAKALDLPLNHLTMILNRANGKPRDAWRVGTRVTVEGEENVLVWPQMQALGVIAIGWDELGDLTGIKGGKEGKAALAVRLQALGLYPDALNVAARKAGEILNFVHGMQEGDLVLAADGETVLGVGLVEGAYRYSKDLLPGAPNRRPVKWLDTTSWRLPLPKKGAANDVSDDRRRREPPGDRTQARCAASRRKATYRPTTASRVADGEGIHGETRHPPDGGTGTAAGHSGPQVPGDPARPSRHGQDALGHAHGQGPRRGRRFWRTLRGPR